MNRTIAFLTVVLAIVSCGDQYNRDDLPWLKKAFSMLSSPLDDLMIDCWALEMKETIQGFSPALS